jgi:hypothetical protein
MISRLLVRLLACLEASSLLHSMCSVELLKLLFVTQAGWLGLSLADLFSEGTTLPADLVATTGNTLFFLPFLSVLCSPLFAFLSSSLLFALCSLLSALCSLLSAPCSLLPAPCSLLSALCSMLSALCSLLSALCSLLSAICYLLSAF